ncbi:hypothetical protein COO60DRAFT_1643786 [Scenedesmus sp. NREL 46B-D3]|nr:hypothetical protein COO60DRAFT_1643786 [Scenedesmus sp. NREL 46B-D3]
MELAVLAGLAYAGYQMARRTPHVRLHAATASGGHDEDDDMAPEALKERWEDAKRPLKTGMFANKWLVEEDPVPFFKSAATQHTSDVHKDMKLALFTGEKPSNGVMPFGFRSSKAGAEVPQIWKPQETASGAPLGFSGSAGTLQFTPDTSRLQASSIQNNVHPLGAPQQVAPDRDPLLRVMPTNTSTKMPGLLQGLTPGGYNHAGFDASKQPLAAPTTATTSMTAHPDSLQRSVAMPVLNQPTSTIAREGPVQPQGTHMRAEGGSRSMAEARARGPMPYAPYLATATRVPSELAVERHYGGGGNAPSGQLAFGQARAIGAAPAAASLARSTTTQGQQQQAGTIRNARAMATQHATPAAAYTVARHAHGGSTMPGFAGASVAAAASASAMATATRAAADGDTAAVVGKLPVGQSRALVPPRASAPVQPTDAPRPRQLTPHAHEPASNRYLATTGRSEAAAWGSSHRHQQLGGSASHNAGVPTRIAGRGSAPTEAVAKGRKASETASAPMGMARAAPAAAAAPFEEASAAVQRARQSVHGGPVPIAFARAAAAAAAAVQSMPAPATTAQPMRGAEAVAVPYRRGAAIAALLPSPAVATDSRKVPSVPGVAAAGTAVRRHDGAAMPAGQATQPAIKAEHANDESMFLIMNKSAPIPNQQRLVQEREGASTCRTPLVVVGEAPMQAVRPSQLHVSSLMATTMTAARKLGGEQPRPQHRLRPLQQQPAPPQATTAPKRGGGDAEGM